MTGKKRLMQTYGMVCLALTIFVVYFCLKIAPFLENGNVFTAVFSALESINTNMLSFEWSQNTPIALLIGLAISFIVSVLILVNVKNYRYGEEHGSAKWGNPGAIAREYAEKDMSDNHLLTKNVRIGFDDRKTNLNSNSVIVGGPGTGKTFRYVLPNILNCGGSMVICDPKGSTLRNSGKYLKKMGYIVRVLDLKDKQYSWGYNPFEYIRNEEDIFKMVDLIFTANTPKNSSTQEPFFDDNAKILFLACCYYLYYKAPKNEQNLPFVLEMLNYLEIRDDDLNYISPFDELFLELQADEPHNLAVDYYLKFKQAKGRTAMSVVSTLIAKIGKYSLPDVKRISVVDELHLRELADKKTALFLLLPDDDKSLNFVCSVLYMQLFQQLYDRAEEFDDDRLPLHVQVYMDEFANIALPDNFDTIIATCRSRNIGISVILQGFAQLKKDYKEAWETITAQCSVFMYMGGMEQSTHEYLSKMLDKETIYLNSFGRSRGKNGSWTKNDQLSGRELLTPGEVRKLQKKHAIVIIQGEDPIMDEMFNTKAMKAFLTAVALGKFNHSKMEREVVTTTVTPIYYDDGNFMEPDIDESLKVLAYSNV